jgi:Rod binding domain-containing protein
MSAISGINVTNALLPASVRNGPPAAKRAYETALGFEGVLVNQLSQEMMATVSSASQADSSDGSTGSAGADPSSGAYSQLLPQALTSSIMSAGGLGIAQQLATSLDPSLRATPSAGGATP